MWRADFDWFMVRFGDSLRSFARQVHVLIVLLW